MSGLGFKSYLWWFGDGALNPELLTTNVARAKEEEKQKAARIKINSMLLFIIVNALKQNGN